MNPVAAIVFFSLFFSALSLRAQEYVQVRSNAGVDTLINRNIAANKAAGGIPGFRVQIFFGSHRKAALDAKTKYLELYPGEEVYMIYQQPYFKVRVGDFRTHLDAQPLLRELVDHFTKVFIVPDRINFPKL
jgi:hypothetical protein